MAHNLKVTGSSPVPATLKGRFYGLSFLWVQHGYNKECDFYFYTCLLSSFPHSTFTLKDK